MEGSGSSLETACDDFQQARNQEAAWHFLYSFESTGASSRTRFLMTIIGIPSGPHALLRSRLDMIVDAIEWGYMHISQE